jgi:hypothetical protein
MSATFRHGALALACGLLAGCGALRAPETAEPAPVVQAVPEEKAAPVPPAASPETLLLYYQHIRRLSGADLAREHDTARQAYARSRSDYERVRLAMVLSLPGSAFSDEGRALELLDPVSKNHNGQLQGLAYLLATHLQERRRLDANAQGLQQKLDALRSLERTMIERKR